MHNIHVNSTITIDAGINPRTFATFALAVGGSNPFARSLPLFFFVLLG
jgi:hypothetical protein